MVFRSCGTPIFAAARCVNDGVKLSFRHLLLQTRRTSSSDERPRIEEFLHQAFIALRDGFHELVRDIPFARPSTSAGMALQ
jgi:hypothetical protein